jgi:4-hydroxy-tetrahydrodipicolinate reductase
MSDHPARLRILLVGYGRMGRLIDALSASYSCEVVARLDEFNNDGACAITPGAAKDVDVAIDFSVAGAFLENFPRLADCGVSVVVGTTGWQSHESRLRDLAARAGIGVVAAPNFSVGVALFQATVESAAGLFAARPDYGAWIHEIHHAAKRDAPSGTALALRAAMEHSGYSRVVDVSSSRAGQVPGTHTVGFDGPSETVTLTHTVRDRSTFAHGALAAARWVHGRHGWFGMRDVLGLAPLAAAPTPTDNAGGPR